MTYTKQNFKDGATLFASQLEAMEDGIINSAPVKGMDYWTKEDKTEIVVDVLAALSDDVNEALALLISCGIVSPVADSSGGIYTSGNKILVY